MNQEDINNLMWNSMPDWRKEQLAEQRQNRDLVQENKSLKDRIKKLEEAVEREARETREREEAEAREKARQESLKPDKEKILSYAAKIGNRKA